MSQFTCPHCRKALAAEASAARVVCPHCRQAIAAPATPAARWFYARNKKKYGPYTWQQLRTLAQRGEVRPDDMLLQEGAKKWLRAEALPELFAGAAPIQSKAGPPHATNVRTPRAFPWWLAGLAGASACALVGFCIVAGFFYVQPRQPAENGHANQDRVDEEKKAKKTTAAPEIDGKQPKKATADDKKKPSDAKPPKDLPTEALARQLLERLNQHRDAASLGPVMLDSELSKKCAVLAQDPGKSAALTAGYEIAAHPPLTALERWMGKLTSRSRLLDPELRGIGLGIEKNARGEWSCVMDTERGRGEPTVVFPAPNQVAVPTSFSGGADVPDPKAAAGFPITVSFPMSQKVVGARIELSDGQGKVLDGWSWTPEKPLRPGRTQNTAALIPKGLLQSTTTYQVKASAQVDGKPWSLAWAFTTDDDSDGKGYWAKKALDKVNAYRAEASLKPVVLDTELSKGCLAHARYLVINEGNPALEGLSAHDEDPKLPGFSEAGRAAGKASDIAIGDYEPIDGLDGWMATLYHRVPILEPNLNAIGFGCARGRRQGWVTVLNVGTGRTKGPRPHAVYYPVPDQVGVPLSFPNGGEEPNPIPESKSGRAGFPVTAFFADREPLQNATGNLTDAKGTEVPCWFSNPEKPANPKFAKYQGATVCLIAKSPLAPDTTYHVHLQGTLAGRAWEKKWRFTTADAGLSVKKATQTVVDRLNANRVQAGLSAVSLDDKLSRGCQLHAEYLVKNADALMKNKASVNDEDAQLPWYTIEGARAAQKSLVFTNAPTPVLQIDDLMATFSSRVYLLDPALQRIGFGCSHDIGRGWRCVLDVINGRGDTRVVLYPGPEQIDIPSVGLEVSAGAKSAAGFPISVTFPQFANVRNVQGALLDGEEKAVEVRLSSLAGKGQRSLYALVPQQPLQAGRTYSVTVSAIVDGAEWRQTWKFTTAK